MKITLEGIGMRNETKFLIMAGVFVLLLVALFTLLTMGKYEQEIECKENGGILVRTYSDGWQCVKFVE